MDKIEISVTFPKALKILVPERLLDEFLERVDEHNLSAANTSALSEELKKLRFRIELKRVRALNKSIKVDHPPL